MNSKKVRKAIGIAILVASCVLFVVYFRKILSVGGTLIGIFMPFIVGFVFAVLTNPLAEVLIKRFKIPRNISAVIVMLIFLGVIGGICAFAITKIVGEIRQIISDPAFMVNIQNTFEQVSAKCAGLFAGLPDVVQETLDESTSKIVGAISDFVGHGSTPLFRSAGNVAKRIPGIFIGVIVFILSYFFMLSDAPHVKSAVKRILSEKTINRMRKMRFEVKKYAGGYVKAQLIIMSIAFVVLAVGFSILGVKYALLIAFLTAMLDALPFFGSGAVLWPWAVVSIISADYKNAVGFIIIYLCVIFTRQMIEPKIVSDKLGMNPLLTLMSMYLGYRLFSIGGMIVGPLAMMFIISIKRAGFFDDIFEMANLLKKAVKREFIQFKNNLRSEDDE